MSSWNELFKEKRNIKKIPEPEIFKFVSYLERKFPGIPLHIWDLCCGGGRHTVAMSELGHKVYANDISPNAVAHTKKWLSEKKLDAEVATTDMIMCPWANMNFNGTVCWDAINHNTIDKIEKTIRLVHNHLVDGGCFLATLKSTKADLYGIGQEIEPNTFVRENFEEKDPHHYFDEKEIRRLFNDKNWRIIILVEQIITYNERPREYKDFKDANPFPYTTWGILAERVTLTSSPEGIKNGNNKGETHV